jgi:hypothetical protein
LENDERDELAMRSGILNTEEEDDQDVPSCHEPKVVETRDPPFHFDSIVENQ